jgi:hypothetical protein
MGGGKTEFYIPNGSSKNMKLKTAPFWARVVCSATSDYLTVCESNYQGQLSVTLK